jgi:CTP synthase
MSKYIFITGGVVSSLGKGIASASIGKLLESRGLKATIIKCDPYINVDPGTMNPYQHGEVYVTDDGAETDLDLGHYERYMNVDLAQENNITTGRVYHTVISKERKGDYLGGTVQVIPHITDEIKNRIKAISKRKHYDVVIVEIGGTVGDIEGLPFLEAIRQLKQERGSNNAINIHLTLVPYIASAGEIKTKPTQHSVAKLRELGIQPEILICRTEKALSKDTKKKISLFCNVDESAVIHAVDAETIYEVPIFFQKQWLDELIVRKLNIKSMSRPLDSWKEAIERLKNPKHCVKIAVIGKYITLQDAYKSIYESLSHAGIENDTRVEILRIDSEELTNLSQTGIARKLDGVCGILIPGGFGKRGIEGKIKAIQYARENNIPYLGLCLGMQTAVIEFARNVCGLKNAHSSEFNPRTPYPVISLLEEQKKVRELGATMRLGSYPCKLKKKTKSYSAYKRALINERHRHRFEFNPEFKKVIEKKGMVIAGSSPDGKLAEIVENTKHPWFVAVQFHPEFKSKPDKAHPLFRDFIKAALSLNQKKHKK